MQQQGFLGLTYPHPDRLLKILFGCSRGLFFASPIALAAPYGLWRLWKEKTYAVPAAVAAGIAAYYFLFNASFYWWKAGLSFGWMHSFIVRWLVRRMGTRDSGLAARARRTGGVQRIPRADGGFDDFAVVDAG